MNLRAQSAPALSTCRVGVQDYWRSTRMEALSDFDLQLQEQNNLSRYVRVKYNYSVQEERCELDRVDRMSIIGSV